MQLGRISEEEAAKEMGEKKRRICDSLRDIGEWVYAYILYISIYRYYYRSRPIELSGAR